MVAPARNVGMATRCTLPTGGYEYRDRAGSVGSVTHEQFMVGYTMAVRCVIPHTSSNLYLPDFDP